MSDVQKIMPVTKVKRGLLDIIKAMQEDGSTIMLTRNGEAVGVMMTPDRYEALFETIEILADKKILAVLKSSAEDFKAGRVYSDAFQPGIRKASSAANNTVRPTRTETQTSV